MRPVLSAFVLALLGGFLGAFVSTESVRRLAIRIGAVDHPGGRRVHRQPTARLGGLGIALGALCALAIALALGHTSLAERSVAGFLLASLVALGVGVIDDLTGLGALPKISGQVLAAILLWAGGWRVESLGLPGIGAISTAAISLPLTIAWVVGVINAVNLIDGLDGLAGGLAFVSALAYAGLLAAAGDPSWMIAVAFAGATAGFLWFNLPPALIFMGDAGSHLLGLALAAFGLRLSGAVPEGMFPLVPMLLLAVPLSDMAWAITRRALHPRPEGEARLASVRAAICRIVRADGAHVHHRLLDAGWTPRAAALLLWRVAAACAMVGVTLAASLPVALALAAIVAGWLVRVVARAGGFVRARAREAAPALAHLEPVPTLEIEVEEIAA